MTKSLMSIDPDGDIFWKSLMQMAEMIVVLGNAIHFRTGGILEKITSACLEDLAVMSH